MYLRSIFKTPSMDQSMKLASGKLKQKIISKYFTKNSINSKSFENRQSLKYRVGVKKIKMNILQRIYNTVLSKLSFLFFFQN